MTTLAEYTDPERRDQYKFRETVYNTAEALKKLDARVANLQAAFEAHVQRQKEEL